MVTVNKKRLSDLLKSVTSEEVSVRLASLEQLSIIMRRRFRKADRVLKRIQDDYGNAFSGQAVTDIIRYHLRKIIRECNPDKEQRAVIAGIYRRIDPDNIEAEKASKRAVVYGLVDIMAAMVLVSFALVIVVEAAGNCKPYKYYKAGKMLEEGSFEEAAEAYEALGDYKESVNRGIAIHDKLGSKYLGQKDYERAVAEYAKAGVQALDKYNYSLAFMCIDNDDYIDAYDILNKVRDFDIEETLKRVTLLAAREYLQKGDIAQCRKLLSELPEGYGIEEFTAKQLRNLIVVNRKWIEQVGRKGSVSGTIGAYEMLSGQCEGWDFDISRLPVQTSVDLEMEIADDMSFSVTVTADILKCTTYARDMTLQSMFISTDTITKTFTGDELSDVIWLDDNTRLIVAGDAVQIRYHIEEMQILPDDAEGDRVLTVKESQITFE